MKILIIFSVFFAKVLSTPNPYYIEPGKITIDSHEEFLSEQENEKLNSKFETEGRIALGTPAKKGEFNELCYISVTFFNKQQTCGCFIYDEQNVVTSARCLRE
jgi:hypothetical protein